MANNAKNAINIAPTFSASFSPSLVPAAAASSTLTESLWNLFSTEPSVSGVSVSGTIILAIIKAAGAEMTQAVARCPASTPICI